jgi:hypothetical protein
MLIVASFPDNNDLVDRHVARLTIIVSQVQHAALDLQYLPSQTRSATAEHIDLLAYKS